MPHKKLWEVPGYKVHPPNERTLQVLYSPQIDKGIKDVTVLMSTLFPHGGRSGLHTHDVDEIMYIITGRGEGVEGEEVFDIEPGVVFYAPAGVKHECRNFSNETMQIFCVYVPSLPDNVVEEFVKNASLKGKNSKIN
ncbi:cupin domain-containing protein [Candidatus Aerophobetes bacterium]|nr:cupin domain-containing protein [Candidatus Aerophobetes bacterium]